MGDRIVIRFKHENERSVSLYAHWMGMSLIDKAVQFYNEYAGKVRFEPSNWMVNFLMYIRKGVIDDGGLYLYPDNDHCCSPDDNGYWEMDLETGNVNRI